MPSIPTLRTVAALTDKVTAADHNNVKTAIETINTYVDSSVAKLGSSNVFTSSITATTFSGSGIGLTSFDQTAINTAIGYVPANKTTLDAVVITANSYTALSSSVVIFCNGCYNVTLPTGTIGRRLTIKDMAGNAASSNIIIFGSIDGATNYTINTNYGSATLVHNGTNWSKI